MVGGREDGRRKGMEKNRELMMEERCVDIEGVHESEKIKKLLRN